MKQTPTAHGARDPITYRHPRTLEQACGPGDRHLTTDAPRPVFDAEDRAVLLVCAICAGLLLLAQLIGLPL